MLLPVCSKQVCALYYLYTRHIINKKKSRMFGGSVLGYLAGNTKPYFTLGRILPSAANLLVEPEGGDGGKNQKKKTSQATKGDMMSGNQCGLLSCSYPPPAGASLGIHFA